MVERITFQLGFSVNFLRTFPLALPKIIGNPASENLTKFSKPMSGM